MPSFFSASASPMRLARIAAAGLAVGAVAACSLPQSVEGTLPDQDNVAQVRVGQSTKADVTRLMGSPGVTSTVDQNVWYYPSRRVGRNTFGDHTVIEQKVYVVHFDDKGVVSQFGTNENDVHDVAMIPRTTPAPGRELSFVEQLLGNFGLADNSASKKKKKGDDDGG